METTLEAGTRMGAVGFVVSELERPQSIHDGVLGPSVMGHADNHVELGARGVVPFNHLNGRPGTPRKPKAPTGLGHQAIWSDSWSSWLIRGTRSGAG